MRVKNTKLCRCGVGTILTGEQRQYNAKSRKDNKDICTDCAVSEAYGLFRTTRV